MVPQYFEVVFFLEKMQIPYSTSGLLLRDELDVRKVEGSGLPSLLLSLLSLDWAPERATEYFVTV
jgi:hypothetical protein